MRTRAILAVGLSALVFFCGTTGAQASRSLVSAGLVQVNPEDPFGGVLDGACGAVTVGGTIYVSNYYRQRVDFFSIASGASNGWIAAPNPLDGVCGLARSTGAIYANEWHESVLEISPAVKTFDSGHESTGVAVDSAGNVYADDRTYVAVYEPSGAPVLHEGQPLKIGAGSLEDGYGLAVAGGRVYVADAATRSVKVYEPAGDPSVPVATIDPGFNSLVDASLAIDPVSGHLLVVDNLQPGFESPEAVIDEFNTSGILIDQFKHEIVDGEPSGLTVSASGNVFVTSGNTEGSNVLEFGPYSAEGSSSLRVGAASAAAPATTSPTAAAGESGGGLPTAAPRPRRSTATASEVVQRDGVRVSFQAGLTPKKLPRTSSAGVRLAFAADIASATGSVPPQLRGISIEINRNGSINPAGLPVCSVSEIQPSTTEGALQACGKSRVGEGTFSAKVLLTQQAPFPSSGKVIAFNGTWHGKPAILAHVFGTSPVPTSYTLPFVITGTKKGTYGTTLNASLPHFTSKWGYVTGISLNLGRTFSSHGRRRSYLSATCPAPKGFNGASFSLARAKLSFEGHGPITETLTRSCGVR